MAYTKLNSQLTPGAQVEEIMQGEAYRLTIPAGRADKYRLAQIYDYAKMKRSQFALQTPVQLSLSARVSSNSIPGTWGFGLWNDPFGLSFGFGGNPFRLPALPNAAWFFGASKENYLSFREPRAERSDKRERGTQTKRGASSPLRSAGQSTAPFGQREPAEHEGAANGFLAQTFRSPRFHPLLVPAGLALPFSRKATRRLMGRVIGEDATALSVDAAQWHRYRLEWRAERALFEVDEVRVLDSPVSPKAPLGLVIWIDNQFAAFTPEGKIGFGVLANPEPAWLEVKDLDVA